MTMNLNAIVTVKGPLFSKKIKGVVEAAIIEESIDKIRERLTRKGAQGSGGKGIGVRRNTVTSRKQGMEAEIESTLIKPRTKGTAYVRKNMGIAKAMTPRVVRAVAKRVVEELN